MLSIVKKFINKVFSNIFKSKKHVKLGLYGPPNGGKCVAPETEIILQNGEIRPIKQIFDDVKLKVGKIVIKDFNEQYIDTSNLNIILPSFDYKSLKVVPKKVNFVYAQKYHGKLYKITTKAGRSLRVTPEHPLIRISNNGVEKVKASQLSVKDCVAIAKNISLTTEIKIPQVAEGFNVNSNGTIQSIAKFHNPKSITMPSYINENLVSFIGYVLSESNHTKNRIKFSNTDEDSLGHFKLLTKKLFSLDYIERVNKGVPEVEINSKTLTDYLDKSLDFKPKLSGDKEIPPALMGLTDNLTAILLRVLFDMEAYVPDVNKNPGGLEIEFTSKSKKLVEQVQILLNRFGIVGRFKEKIVNDESYWRLLIGGSDNHRLFRDKIGFNLKSKANRLNALCQCGLKRNRFFLPIVGLLDNLRQSLGLTQKQFFLDDKHVARMKRDNRITYHRIEEMADSTDNPMLRKLANSDNKWDEIANIEQEDYDDYVYDLTIEDTHTFIVSNGLIAHNTTLANKICQDWLGEDMGSVSNMAHETREIQIKEQVNIKKDGKELSFNLVDTPGIATRIDYEDFLKHGMKEKDAKGRAKEATKGVIDSIKWLDDMDAVIIVLDSTKNPYSQVNVTIIGNLEARKIPVLICANKTDLKKSDLKKVKSAFPQYDVVPISAKYAKGMEEFYEGLFVLVGK